MSEIDYTTKVCTNCKQEKHVSEFSICAGKLKSQCKKCLAEKASIRYAANKDKILQKEKERRLANLKEYNEKQRNRYYSNADKTREYNLKRYFGITLDQYSELLESQNGGCAICGKTPAQEGKNLAVDHNHKNLSIRGLLCGWCNRHFIGHHTNPELFKNAYSYLSRDTGLFVPETAPKRRRKKKKKKVKPIE